MSVVADAVARINHGDLEKVVPPGDLVATTDEPVDVRWPPHRLSEVYPMCWTFHVDGMFGATPEMLAASAAWSLTGPRRHHPAHWRRRRDLALAATARAVLEGPEEHEYAVRSVADALEPHCSMNVPEAPFRPPPAQRDAPRDRRRRVVHAATVSSLAAGRGAAPSAAVGGTPTGTATDLIGEIEGMDRDRYAGRSVDGRRRRRRVGIALRSASISGSTVRLFAAAASSPTPTPRPSWPRPRRSSSWSGRAHHGLRLRTGWFRGDVIRPGRPSRQPA